jgi:hypothetical protein
VARFILIGVVAGLGVSLSWYAWFLRYNRRRAGQVLQWVEDACLGKGRVVDLQLACQQFPAEGDAESLLPLV